MIPKVTEVVHLARRDPQSQPWEMPTHCPACHTPVVKIAEEVAVRCPNEEGCPEQCLRRLIYFASKHAFDIQHLGERVMQQLFERGLVRTPSDIYTLTDVQLSQLEGFKHKSVYNLLSSIETSKTVTLARFIMGLGIKHVGITTAEVIAARAGSIESFMQMQEEIYAVLKELVKRLLKLLFNIGVNLNIFVK